MKFATIFVLLLVAFAALTSAQQRPSQQRCAGRPRASSCTGALDLGRRGRRRRRCTARSMWYYDVATRQCLPMRYLGCGGNNNRWCSKAICEQNCRR